VTAGAHGVRPVLGEPLPHRQTAVDRVVLERRNIRQGRWGRHAKQIVQDELAANNR
jgi:hypothetical protein